MVLLTLSHMRPGVIKMEVRDREVRVFSTMKRAEKWLKNNNFYYGRRSFFNYQGEYQEWCHSKEVSWDFVDVNIQEYEMDQDTDSQYKEFYPKRAPWMEGYNREED